MRHGRLLWAAVMCAAAITVLAGYTAAGEPRWTEPVWNGGRAPALLQTEPQAAEAETPPEPGSGNAAGGRAADDRSG